MILANLSDFASDFIILFLLIWGPGHWLWRLRNDGPLTLPDFLGSLLCGASLVAFLGWAAGVAGLFTGSFAWLAFGIGCLASATTFWKHFPRIARTTRWKSDLVITLAVLPTLAYCSRFPALPGDAFYSWYTWTLHWASRSDLSDYLFGGYGQWMPVLLSYLYKIKGSASTPLPNQMFSTHMVGALFGLLGILTLKRTLEFVLGERKVWLAWLLVTLLLLQQDFIGVLSSMTVEVFLFSFSSLLLHELVTEKKGELGKTQRSVLLASIPIALLLGGLGFAKATGLLWSFLFCCFWPLLSLNQRVHLPLFSRALISALLFFGMLVPLPFYLQQSGRIGNARFDNPQNHSPGKAVKMLEELEKFTVMIKDHHRWTGLQGFAFFFKTREAQSVIPVSQNLVTWAIAAIFLALFFLGACSSLWAFLLGVASLVVYLLWWKYAGYGRYNYVVAYPVVLVVASQAFLWVPTWVRLALEKRSPWGIGLCIGFAMLGFYFQRDFLRACYPNAWRQPWFISLEPLKRVELFFPADSKGVSELHRLHSGEFDKVKPEKLLILGTVNSIRLVPNSAINNWGKPNGYTEPAGFAKMFADLKNENISLLENAHLDGAIELDGVNYLRPASRFFNQEVPRAAEIQSTLLVRFVGKGQIKTSIESFSTSLRFQKCRTSLSDAYGAVRYTRGVYLAIDCPPSASTENTWAENLTKIRTFGQKRAFEVYYYFIPNRGFAGGK